MWSIEAHGRVTEERNKARAAEAEVRKVQDQQKIELARAKQKGKEEDKALAARMEQEDLEKVTREAQVEAYKRHQVAK